MKIEEVKCPECRKIDHFAAPLNGSINTILFVCRNCRELWQIPCEEFEKVSLKNIAREESMSLYCPKCCSIKAYSAPVAYGDHGVEHECSECKCNWSTPP